MKGPKQGAAALSVAGLACLSVLLAPSASAGSRVPGVTRVPLALHAAQTGGPSSVTGHLHRIVTIGSTIDPLNGDQNPYGLAIAPVNSGKFTAGDLVVCNFNDALNIQGLGTTIEILHPAPGSQPVRFLRDDRLAGCAALALESNDSDPWIAAYTANDNPVTDSLGNFQETPPPGPIAQPWGQALSDTPGPYGLESFYETNARNGTIVRFAVKRKSNNPHHPIYSSHVIASGFSVNHGVPGAILAPSGLTYDQTSDTLYIVDGNVDRLVAFHNVGRVPPHGITVKGDSFGGPAASSAEVIYRGAPLAAPISAALLFNGNVVVGNTANNVLVEVSPALHAVVHMVNLDKGAPGALFGIAAAGVDRASTQVFFNDDNDNTVKVLER